MDGFSLPYQKPFYNEFLMKCPPGIYERLRDAEITPGLDVSEYYPRLTDCILICTTELHSKCDLDYFLEVLR